MPLIILNCRLQESSVLLSITAIHHHGFCGLSLRQSISRLLSITVHDLSLVLLGLLLIAFVVCVSGFLRRSVPSLTGYSLHSVFLQPIISVDGSSQTPTHSLQNASI